MFSRDVFKRTRRRLAVYSRRLTKDPVSDLAGLLRGEDPKVVIDVGANVGFVTWQFLKAFKNANIYALEPDPVTFGTLKAVHGDNPRVHVLPIAAADQEGEVAFIQRQVSSNSSLCEMITETSGNHTIKVKATTLDRLCAEHSIGHIHLLKIDTEGADLRVLQGATAMLGRGAVEVIMAEFHFIPTYKGDATLDELTAFLKGFDFRVFNFYVGAETSRGQARYGNAIFVGPRWHKELATTK